jgi:hypothetical protein
VLRVQKTPQNWLAHPRVKASAEELRETLRGRVTKHHRFLCAFISIRSTLSKLPWRRSMRKWKRDHQHCCQAIQSGRRSPLMKNGT